MQFYEVLVGFGIGRDGFGVILLSWAGQAPRARAMSLAIATAAGSAGQIVGPTVAVSCWRRWPGSPCS